MQDNVLKATTEAHLFTILVLVLTLKSGLNNEILDEGFYDNVCTVLFVMFVPVAAVLCVAHKWRTVVRHSVDDRQQVSHTDRLRQAFNRHRLGQDKDEDRTLLAEYLEKLEDEISTDFHVFISYRVATEAALAKQLYEKLSSKTLAETGQKLRVYLDQICLEDGERWDAGFMQGLGASWIAVPIVSAGSLGPMAALFDEDGEPTDSCDNVLLEWTAMLELYNRAELMAVMPIIACSQDGSEFSWGLPRTLGADEHTPTITAANKHLRNHASSRYLSDQRKMLAGVNDLVQDVLNSQDGQQAQNISVSGVVGAILRFQGILLTDRSDLGTCVDRIFTKTTALLNNPRAGREDDDQTGNVPLGATRGEALTVE